LGGRFDLGSRFDLCVAFDSFLLSEPSFEYRYGKTYQKLALSIDTGRLNLVRSRKNLIAVTVVVLSYRFVICNYPFKSLYYLLTLAKLLS
jgi:hypothetical protein